ncbi:diacylglycerol kinase family protein [Flammeovirgaceae bacterium SG7u.111]|nr:diacylglycerol kinase family protein [Flammeovirgaceae bacterium SG7u.132]WPO38138.1 diacylglycerol kinase family protein [Flammeovirgaceae bacterium SG7u.111]
MKVLMVNNPISGGNDKSVFLDAAKKMAHYYGIELVVFNTTGKDDIEKLKGALEKEQPDRVASVGGDGTSLMTSEALIGSETPFGIVPFGSANGMAKELGVDKEPIDAFRDILVSQLIIPLDLVKVNDAHHLLHLGDAGANAYMVEKFSQEEGRGWLGYAKHFIEAIKNEEKFNVRIFAEGEWHEHEAYSIILANARMYGTGVIVNSKGNPHDGYFEIIVIQKSDLSGLVNLGISSITKESVDALESYHTSYKVKEAEIQFEHPRLFQLDGEVMGELSSIKAQVLNIPLNYITTANNSFIGDLA